jgi:hypothetical protein
MTPNIVDYSKSVIYKIEHIDNPELLYVGSTTDFIRRKSNHKHDCNYINGNTYNLKLYTMIRDNGNWESFKIMIIKEFPCNNKIELIIEEEKHRKELQATLNSNRAYVSIETTKELKKEYSKIKEYKQKYYEIYNENLKEKAKEYRETNKDKIKEYRETNKDKIKEYRENNKEKIKEKAKEYREANKEQTNKKEKEYYELNKEKLKEKMTCNCGSIFRKGEKARHYKSLKHINFINN